MAARKRILAIDDEISVCELYEQGLPPLGYEVACAASAKKAKELLAKSLPDLILMDIMMPDQDGISLTRDLRAEERTAHVPIVVVSGLSDAATLNDALLFGAVDYMVKPIDLEALRSKIERTFAALEKRQK